MKMTILLFDRFTALDVVGGYEVLARLPDIETSFVATEVGVVAADTRRLGLVAYERLAEVEHSDILYVPGGPGVEEVIADSTALDAIAALSERATWTVGICNGVAILGAAGLLAGRRVTTNWSWRDRVAAFGAEVVHSRYVVDGDLATSAGVSASIDGSLALAAHLAGDGVAELVQLGIEYFPEPPFGARSVDEVPEVHKALLRAWVEEQEPLQLDLVTPWSAQ